MRLRLRLRPLRERGDTIVEVLIAIAVISTVLGGAYVVTNRNFMNTRDSQERSNAVKLVEGQIEQLKSIVASNPNAVFGSSAPASFCIIPGTPTVQPSVVGSSNSACQVDTAGSPTTSEPVYRLSITRSGNTFTIQSRWTHVRGHTTNQMSMKYRVYQ